MEYCPCRRYIKGDRRFLILTDIYYNMIRVCQGQRSMSTLVTTFWCKTYILYLINNKRIHVDVMSMLYCPCWSYVMGVLFMLTLCQGRYCPCLSYVKGVGPCRRYIKGDRRFLILTDIYYNMIFNIYVFMDPCLGYVNAYIWTPNCHVM